VTGLDQAGVARAVEERRGAFAGNAESQDADSDQREMLTRAFDEIEARLAVATERCAPRTRLPPRFARFGFLAPLVLGAYNYMSKSQREAIAEQTIALASLVAVLRLIVKAYDD
jgi:hypothetical protein